MSRLVFMAGSLLLLGSLAATAAADSLVLHVATNGHDGWSGKLASPNTARTDGPLASLTGARDKVRGQRSEARGQSGAVTVLVHGGMYRMEAPFVLESQDSGTADAPVVYAAFENERPVFSGGRVLTDFQRRGNLWEASLPEVKAGRWHFRQLFVNGQRRTRARSPNDGYHRIAALLPGPKDARSGKAVARDKFGFAPGDLKPYARLGDVNLILMHSWETSIHPLKSVDRTASVVEFAAPLKEWWSIGYWETNQRYYVENALELLDAPGEWYLNRESGVLSYWPMPGEKLGEVEVVAPRLPELVRLAGDADQGRFVEHVTLRGLAFHHSDWELDPKGNSSTQAAVEVPAAILADGARHCAFEGCEVAHVGTYGLWLRRGCKDCRVQRTRLFDLGAGGLRVGEDRMAKTGTAESSRNLIDNNHLFDGGHVYAGCVGLWLAQSSANRISHNDLHDFPYTGISVGWNWGLEPNRTSNNVIEFNHVHDLGHGVMSDAGLIYCLGNSPGSVIRQNVFHDMWPYSQPAFGWGIYLDAQCGNYLVESNLVYNTQSGGLMFNNGGHEHVIRNNIFALSATHALWPYSEKRPSAFQRNIVYLTQGDLLIPYGERSLNERLAAKESPGLWDGNLYWHTGGAEQLRFYRRTFAEWQALGLDPHSRIADPRFVNAAAHDFRLQPDSPALALGFQPFDISQAGLYGDAAWANEVRHDRCAHKPLPPPPPKPKPLDLDDGFETTAVGTPPAQAHVSGEEQGASIRVSEERAATGRRSLKITDSKVLQPAWQPHFYYEPHLTRGTVRFSFDVWLSTNTEFFTEWRDTSTYPQNIGPSVRFDDRGNVSVGGRTLTAIPLGQWVGVEVEASLGRSASRTFKLTLAPRGAASQVFTGLPFGGKGFAELRWLGFSSTAAADTVFFLDNLRLKQPIP
ncbi:MAG: right-handed parallel beta-helix repeat-containing protein [Verrucomicrobia bacterium]|nr:right-handed parallel beta-helix repeat-containing protein [Verrucomicrobiota bacterium]